MASTSPFSPKRQCPYRPFNKAENTASSPSDVGLPGLLMLIIRGVYIKADGYRQETPNGNPIYETTLSKFRALGDVKALGHADDPALILVHRVVQLNLPDLPKPPLCVKDDHQRIFELQFLLLGEGAHMLMCFNFSKNIWILYDDDPARRSFRHFKFEEELDCYMICLAGYVSTTRVEEHNHGVPETGAGAQPFESDSSRQQNISEESVDDVLMMLGDLSCGTSE
ncbi:hypothetical protein SRHO_G00073630 [Serrasalmus rhombeus]